MVRFIISIVLLLVSILLAIVIEKGSILSYVGFTALIVELLVPFFAMLAVWRFKEIGHAFSDAFSKKTDAPSRARSVRIWEFTEKVCYASGVIGLILGIVLILSRVSGSLNELGGAFAVSLLAPLYGVLFAIVCRIMKARVEQ